MTRFISKCLCFIIVGLFSIGVSLFAIFFAPKLKFEYGNMAKSEDYKNCFDNIVNDYTVVLGNSKALAAIDAKYLSELMHNSVYNLAFSSSDLTHSKIILKSVCSKSIKPKNVFLEVSWFSFNNKRTELHMASLVPILLNTKKENFPSFKEEVMLLKKGLLNAMFNYLRTRGNAINAIYNDRWNGNVENPNQINKHEFYKVFPDGEAKINEKLFNDLEEIIDVCKKNNIRLVLFTASESNEFKKCQVDRKFILGKLQELASSRETEFVDLSDILSDDNGNSILSDSHHVSNERFFTEKFFQRINKVADYGVTN
jgi:hypothetical protein